MSDLLNKFSEAAKAVSSRKTDEWEGVKRAFADHLNDISTDSLPEEIKIDIECQIRKAKAECNRLRRILDGQLDR